MSRSHVARPSSSFSECLKSPTTSNMDESPGSLSQQLDVKISKLNDALHYWRTWEAEYEGLKEELDGQEEPTAQEMVGSAV
jgi:hypothetical protein